MAVPCARERAAYRNRTDAGRQLARALAPLVPSAGVTVLGIPRGGATVARVVADALGAPMEVVVVRKLGVPGLPEVALGAIAEGATAPVLDPMASYLGVPGELVQRLADRESREVQRRLARFRGGRSLPHVRGETVVLVDDGLASGATMRAAVALARARGAARVIVAAPVASPASGKQLAAVADHVVAPLVPDRFEMVSAYYDDFAPVADAEVLAAAGRPTRADRGDVKDLGGDGADSGHVDGSEERPVSIAAQEGVTLAGDLGSPAGWLAPGEAPRGLLVFAHGGGSSRMSYRNRYLAGALRMAGWETLRLDLLTAEEQGEDVTSADLRFDIPRIARRLSAAIEWAARRVDRPNEDGPIVLFGASTGAAAAVVAATAHPHLVRGVISRGGRVDLAGDALRALRAPLLLLVGGSDAPTLRANRDAIRVTRADVTLRVVRGAGHTFEEPGAIGAVGAHAARWLRGLGPTTRASSGWWRRLW